jgi:hypothetical protein
MMIDNLFRNSNLSRIILLNIIIIFFTATVLLNLLYPYFQTELYTIDGNEFTWLAQSFLQGRLDLVKPGTLDCSFAGDKCFWGPGPAPAVLLMPLVFLTQWFGVFFPQGLFNIFSVLLIFYLCLSISKKFGYRREDSLWLALAFCFASMFLGVALDSRSWYFSQVITALFLMLAINEYFYRKRYWLIGVFLAVVFATRFNAGLAIIFFGLDIIFMQKKSFEEKIRDLFWLGLPIFICGLGLLGYNYARFGNAFDNGYSRALVGPQFQSYLRDHWGLFSPHFILNNLYYYFLKMPQPVLLWNNILVAPYFKIEPMGLSFFLVAPVFVYLYRADYGRGQVRAWALAALAIMMSLLMYSNPGYFQFGPRYMIDLLPLMFVLLLYSFRDFKLTRTARGLIGLSAFANLYFYFNMWIAYGG